MLHFGSVKAGVRMPNGSKIKLTKLSISHAVLGTSLFIALISNTSCCGSYNNPNVRLVGVWFKYKLICFWMLIIVWYILEFLDCLKQTQLG